MSMFNMFNNIVMIELNYSTLNFTIFPSPATGIYDFVIFNI